MALNQLDPNLVRPFDERDLRPAGDGTHTFENVHALAPEPVESCGKVVDAETDVVDGPPARGLKRLAALPQIRPLCARVVDRINDDAHVICLQEGCGGDRNRSR